MASARDKVEALFAALGRHLITIDQAPGTTPEYKATLDKLKTALWDLTDITRELIPLENGEQNQRERSALSNALARGVQADNMIVNFIQNYCDDGHPGALVNHRMETISLTDKIILATKTLQGIVHEYKKRNDRL